MTQACERKTESEYEERRYVYEQNVQCRAHYAEAPSNLTELAEAINSMQQHFANLDAMPADYQFDRYSLTGWLVWARRDLERAAKIVDTMKPEPARQKLGAVIQPSEVARSVSKAMEDLPF